jgi:hypothetical protein
VKGVRPKAKVNTAATGAHVGNLAVMNLSAPIVGNAIISAEYSSKALDKSNNCNRVSSITGPDLWVAREPRYSL